jgi:hypothetical protein
MKFKTAKYFLLFSIIITSLIIVITEPALASLNKGFFNKFESSFFEPIFYWSIALATSSLILLFFSREVFALWYRKVFLWFVPVGLVVTFLTSSGISYGGLSRLSTALFLGELLIVITLVFALVQKFKYKQ